ncbi:winged helix-turn-helix domain-containing protein [Streptomyces coffeae]|uniref:Winged helix-turn-helix transcriptional regulator n=1 Tax=Streptomyces coffeae TaxID=621382 RepID=A0ABS1NCK4_9ACTN|nr:winged helix-turn-helix transcriptional regulator [Streptomyces coffeae]
MLGTARARLLHTIAETPGATTDIARRMRILPSTASRQISALREAGLIVSRRYGNKSAQCEPHWARPSVIAGIGAMRSLCS